MEHISLSELEDKLNFFQKMYDSVRLVDPVEKKVIDYRQSSVCETREVCYNYWGNKKICDNCISVRAYHEDKSFVKLERNKDTVLLVTALPVADTKRPVILELMKNATDAMFLGTGEYSQGEPLQLIVQQLNDMIVKDTLTTLYNRRFVDERLPIDIVKATLTKSPLSVCFLDLDHFKSLNDLYGHEAGDFAIKTVSDVIMKHIRTGYDWAARYGGDEFLICFTHADEKQAYVIAERIRNGVGDVSLDFNGQKVSLSISFGIKTMEQIPFTAEEMIDQADKKMYKAKREKR